MIKKILLFVTVVFFFSCSSVKNTQQAINSGDYDKAIHIAVKNLTKNKSKKSNQPYVVMLEEAFQKATERDLNRIDFLKKDQNSDNLETVYKLYTNLKNRQETIKALLPIPILATGKNAVFKMNNYDTNIIQYKDKTSEYLYGNAKTLFLNNNKFDYRKAYEDLNYIDQINPNYRDIRNLKNTAHARGIDYVFVSMKNETDKVVPKRLEEDLLNFDTYGLNDFWTVYHTVKESIITYDFALELNLRDIQVSPERISEKEFIKEKQVKDGFTYALDADGNQIIDSEGNKVKVDKFINVRCELYRFTQSKAAKVTGQVKFIDNQSSQVIQVFPIESEFVFEHVYANYRGDRRALARSFFDLTNLKDVPFPTNEQMIYDAGTDLKGRLKNIINRNKFRN